ncbi:hypothetical protein Zmor_008660 [Zophobas morio]|uniref:DUF3800 domain-containing protein n=1 Tax=Zophobas morio TaxID=2755281 RepID=A0AA38LZB6_9CUCU|nr:hypothetical protein Zmor_008660 [Zophobas morio]
MSKKSENYKLKVYFALDESGKLSQNDVCTHFIIGGFIYSDKDFIKKTIRRVETEVKHKFHIKDDTEFKGSGFSEAAIVALINGVFDVALKRIVPVFSVVDKEKLGPNFTMSESLAYNFFVDNLFHFYSKKYGFTRYASEISLLMDQRNLKKNELNDLENILKTNYIEKPYTITSYYLESRNADVIRFADILDHVVYHLHNNANGEKAKYFRTNIKPEYMNKIKKGSISYPFKQSYFDDLKKIREQKLDKKVNAQRIVDRLKQLSINAPKK